MEIDARGSEKSLSFCYLKIDNIFCVSRLTREGSGNFLTETYLSLRRLENEALDVMQGGMMSIDTAGTIKVSIQQFYGIEINDFAVKVAKTALWIAEAQMLQETKEILYSRSNLSDFLPLEPYENIVEGNALRIDWNNVISNNECTYIMGNPPFIGYYLQTDKQKDDLKNVLLNKEGKVIDNYGKVDYVVGWYYKAAHYINNKKIKVALVSTNSITQGEQVSIVWKCLINDFNIDIFFAHKTFIWDSEASIKAHVHCVIIGFTQNYFGTCKLFNRENIINATNISPYLLNSENIFIDSRNNPICDVPSMRTGSRPVDDGNLIFDENEKNELIKKYPKAEKYILRYCGAVEYLHNIKRYCLWMPEIDIEYISEIAPIKSRIENVREFRLNSKKENTRKFSDYPYRFIEIKQPDTNYIIIPSTSSENRRYIPMGYMDRNVIASNACSIIADAGLYELGILESNVHMAWMRVVAGRLKSDYRYSNNIVYNNFPWPNPTKEQKEKIEKTAQLILDARAKYPNSSLADLYDELTMPPELRKAHQANDIAVYEAYRKAWDIKSESDCVAKLLEIYQELVEKK